MPEPAERRRVGAGPGCRKCVVLAGGRGTRLGPLLGDGPKPMAMIAGRPFIDWIVMFLAANRVRDLVISTGYRGEVIAAHFEKNPPAGMTVRCVREPAQLGTGGAVADVLGALPAEAGAWLVCNGDSLALTPLEGLFQALEDETVDGAMLGLRVADASRFGILSVGSGRTLTAMAAGGAGPALINSGIYLLRSRLFDTLPARRPLSLEQDVIPQWMREGRRIRVIEAACPFLDMGTPSSFAEAAAFVATHRARLAAGGAAPGV